MRPFRHFMFAVATLACMLACEKQEEGLGNKTELESAGSIDLTIESLASSSVVFSCDLTVHPDAGKSFKAGIMYSTNPKFTTSSAKRVLVENPVEGTHTLTLDELVFSTTYYYSSYVYRLGKYELSEVKSFTTADIDVEAEITDLKHNEVTVEGRVLLNDFQKDKVRVGFLFSDSRDFEPENTLENALELDEEGRFKMTVTGLTAGATYYYAYTLSQSATKFKGEAVRFDCLDPYSDAYGDLDIALATDLSAAEAANSYIVTAAGVYKFKAVKGNSTESVEGIDRVLLFWETTGTAVAPEACSLIDATSYKDGYAAFKVSEGYQEGNALLVAEDKDGIILWSWHIWLLSEMPAEHTYKDGAGVMMDRNLGALSMEKGDPKGFGLLYQWGRKDPFPGSATVTGSKMAATTAKTLIALSTQETGTMEYAVKNPDTMIIAGEYADWLYGGSDNTLWQSEKTMYDPCPSGWRVPDGGSDGIWAKAGLPNGSLGMIDDDPTDTDYTVDTPVLFPYPEEDSRLAGMTIPAEYCGADAWYPTAGGISPSEAVFTGVGEDGYYWSVNSYVEGNQAFGFHFWYYGKDGYGKDGGYVYHSARLSKSMAASVRCCKID